MKGKSDVLYHQMMTMGMQEKLEHRFQTAANLSTTLRRLMTVLEEGTTDYLPKYVQYHMLLD